MPVIAAFAEPATQRATMRRQAYMDAIGNEVAAPAKDKRLSTATIRFCEPKDGDCSSIWRTTSTRDIAFDRCKNIRSALIKVS